MGVQKGITDKQLLLVVQEHDLFAEYHTTYPVGQDNVFIHPEVNNVLMTSGFVYARITVDSQVERLVMLNKGFVQ